MKRIIRVLVFINLFIVTTSLNAQDGEEYQIADSINLSEIDIPDLSLHFGSPNGNMDMYYDSTTLVVKAYVGDNKKRKEIYEDAEGNQFVEDKGRWYKMNMKNVLGRKQSWMGSTYEGFPKLFPYHAVFHRMVEFAQITPKMLTESGFNRTSPIGANVVFEHATHGVYQFNSEERLVAMRKPPHASITFEYKNQDVVIPNIDSKMGMLLPGFLSKKRNKKIKN